MKLPSDSSIRSAHVRTMTARHTSLVEDDIQKFCSTSIQNLKFSRISWLLQKISEITRWLFVSEAVSIGLQLGASAALGFRMIDHQLMMAERWALKGENSNDVLLLLSNTLLSGSRVYISMVSGMRLLLDEQVLSLWIFWEGHHGVLSVVQGSSTLRF